LLFREAINCLLERAICLRHACLGINQDNKLPFDNINSLDCRGRTTRIEQGSGLLTTPIPVAGGQFGQAKFANVSQERRTGRSRDRLSPGKGSHGMRTDRSRDRLLPGKGSHGMRTGRSRERLPTGKSSHGRRTGRSRDRLLLGRVSYGISN